MKVFLANTKKYIRCNYVFFVLFIKKTFGCLMRQLESSILSEEQTLVVLYSIFMMQKQ